MTVYLYTLMLGFHGVTQQSPLIGMYHQRSRLTCDTDLIKQIYSLDGSEKEVIEEIQIENMQTV